LHGRIDPSYQYEKKNFQDEVPTILKMLKWVKQLNYSKYQASRYSLFCRYPMADLINKNSLYSIAAPYTYPTFIALLRWLTEMCQVGWTFIYIVC
jgi:SMC interacting uncharacterized protein involved in chromosome segregation